MAKYGIKPNFKKCEPSQEKIDFKQAYSIVRGLFSSRNFAFASPKHRDYFCIETDAIKELFDHLNIDKSIRFKDALKVFNDNNSYTFEELPIWHRAKARTTREGNKVVQGKLPA